MLERRRWARLLPDYRTLYLSLDEMNDHRHAGESDAEVLVRCVRYAQEALENDGSRRLLAREIMNRAGLPTHDALGLELALALVARSRFLSENPHVEMVTVDEPEPEA